MNDPAGEDDVHVLDVDFDRVWHGISGRLWATEPGSAEVLARRLLRSPALARALVATPSLFVAWLLASAVIFAVGAVMTSAMDEPVVPLLAPAVAGVGVSLAYGPGADPAWEITRTTAVPEGLLLLLRVAIAFVTNMAIGLFATLLTGWIADVTYLWLLPMAAIATFGLAVAIVTGSSTGGGVAALAIWAGAIGATYLDTRRAVDVISTARIETQAPLYLSLLLLGAAVIWYASVHPGKWGIGR